MKRILFVGEHPLSVTGNSGMMESILGSVDTSRFFPICYATESTPIDPRLLSIKPIPFPIISISVGDPNNSQKLMATLNRVEYDAVVMVGMDIWNYFTILPDIRQILTNKRVPWASIFPYDLQYIRKDWVEWIKLFDYPCVYSKYGYNLLQDAVSNIKYFRPLLQGADIWKKFDEEERNRERRKYFPNANEDTFVFGFVGANQIRKDPMLAIKAFSVVRNKYKEDIRMYLHSELNGRYNLQQYAIDCRVNNGELFAKQPGAQIPLFKMVSVYNSLDCLVNCSLQEGLSWTLIEAMLCGVPFIASRTTSQIELLENAGYGVPCEEPTYLPLYTKNGESWLDAKRCKLEDLVDAMCTVYESEDLRKELSEKGLKAGKEWLNGVSNINDLLEEMLVPKQIEVNKTSAVLFVQKSSAGDVLMTTRCFKGLKERYKDTPIHYMTSKQYMDIVENNPYIEKVVPWDDVKMRSYPVILNPHGERILPGHWGRNSNSLLSDFYWKILEVEPDDFYIEMKRPDINVLGMPLDQFIEGSFKPLAVLHTTGGDPVFRTYKYMEDVHKGIKDKYTTIQLGGKDDYPVWGVDIDLRGKLSFKETAWVMSHASIAVTVDSFVSHLAGAYGVSQVCLFGSGNHFVVRPNQVKGKLTCLVPDYVKDCPGLGPCSGSVKDCPAKCTGRHDPKDILKAIEEIERGDEYETFGSRLQSVQ